MQELQNQAIGTAAQYAGDLAEIGRVQDASRMGADQQYYTQLFGSTDRDNALNMARLDSAMAAQNLQDASRLSRDQQVYSQLLGSGEQDYSRGIGQLGAVADAQNLQDETALRGDIARFESDLAGTGQQFDQSRFANVDDLARNEMLYNQFGGLLDVGIAGAGGLTGNTDTFGTLGGGIYSDIGDRIGYEGLKKGDRIGNVLGTLFNR